MKYPQVDMVLATMRSVYSCAPVDMSEWLGDGAEAGVKDFIQSLFVSESKRSFKAGYAAGSADTVGSMETSMPVDYMDLMRVEADHYSEGAFLKWEKE
jgi:hypothetical protein